MFQMFYFNSTVKHNVFNINIDCKKKCKLYILSKYNSSLFYAIFNVLSVVIICGIY